MEEHSETVQNIADWLPEIRRFLTNDAYQLRTPLNSIIGMSELLLEDDNGLTREEIENYLNGINQMAQLLREHYENFWLLSRIETGVYRPDLTKTDLAEIIQGLASNIEHHVSVVYARKTNLSLDLSENLPFIVANRDIFLILFEFIQAFIRATDSSQQRLQVTRDADQVKLRICNNSADKPARFIHPIDIQKQAGFGSELFIAHKLMDIYQGSVVISDGNEAYIDLIFRIAQESDSDYHKLSSI